MRGCDPTHVRGRLLRRAARTNPKLNPDLNRAAARKYLVAHDGGEVVHALIIAARGGAARTVDAVREEHRAQRRQRGLVVPPRQRPVSPGNIAANDCRILLFYGPFRLCSVQQLFEAGRAIRVLCLDFRRRGLPRVDPKEVPPQPGPRAGAEALALSDSQAQRSGADDCALSGKADILLADEGFRGRSHA
jgi:hypothetical protein